MQRASSMNLESKLSSSKTKINNQKLEQLIIMWKNIKYLTLENNNPSLQSINIPVDENIKWNSIKQPPNLQFKTFDDPEIMDYIIADRNSHHLD